jgi:hypothetical protein
MGQAGSVNQGYGTSRVSLYGTRTSLRKAKLRIAKAHPVLLDFDDVSHEQAMPRCEVLLLAKA